MTRLRNERGGILAMAAVMLPVFLLMCALIVDAGNWFTHKRQLQNRADAAALAAGVEYLAQLSNCTDPVTRPTAMSSTSRNGVTSGGRPGARETGSNSIRVSPDARSHRRQRAHR